MKFIALVFLPLIFKMPSSLAQVDAPTMAVIREINCKALRVLNDYENYSIFPGFEDYIFYYRDLFSHLNVKVYCDVLNDAKMDDLVNVSDYIDIVKNNYSETYVTLMPEHISWPVFTGNTGQVDIKVSKILEWTNKCKVTSWDTFSLIFSIRFQQNKDNFDNFKISGITNPDPQGKPVVFILCNKKGTTLSHKQFVINGSDLTTDKKGRVKVSIRNSSYPFIISFSGEQYFGLFRFNSYSEFRALMIPGSGTCIPVTIRMTLPRLPVAKYHKTDKKHREKKRQKTKDKKKIIIAATPVPVIIADVLPVKKDEITKSEMHDSVSASAKSLDTSVNDIFVFCFDTLVPYGYRWGYLQKNELQAGSAEPGSVNCTVVIPDNMVIDSINNVYYTENQFFNTYKGSDTLRTFQPSAVSQTGSIESPVNFISPHIFSSPSNRRLQVKIPDKFPGKIERITLSDFSGKVLYATSAMPEKQFLFDFNSFFSNGIYLMDLLLTNHTLIRNKLIFIK